MLSKRLFQDWNGALIDVEADPPQETGAWAGVMSMAGRSIGPLGLSMPPRPSEDFYEWQALLSAHDFAKGRFVMYEFGAGYGRWGVNGILLSRERNRGTKPAHVVFVEASSQRVAALHEHLALNGISIADHQIHTAALTASSGPVALFGSGYGSLVADRGGVEVPGYPIAHWLSLTDGPVDTIHMDVQTAEFACLTPDNLALLKGRVRMMHISTHGHIKGFGDVDEQALSDRIRAAGWTIVSGAPADRLIQTPYGVFHTCDGWLTAVNEEMI